MYIYILYYLLNNKKKQQIQKQYNDRSQQCCNAMREIFLQKTTSPFKVCI